MSQYVLVHIHDFGTTAYFFQCERNLLQDEQGNAKPFSSDGEDAEKLAKVLGIDFEPDLGEGLDIFEAEQYKTIEI